MSQTQGRSDTGKWLFHVRVPRPIVHDPGDREDECIVGDLHDLGSQRRFSATLVGIEYHEKDAVPPDEVPIECGNVARHLPRTLQYDLTGSLIVRFAAHDAANIQLR